MNDSNSTERKPLEATFVNFLATLRLQILVCLGHVPDPATKTRKRNLEQARYLIDILQILQKKTAGNLDETEEKALQGILYEAQMRYVQAVDQERAAT